MKKRKKKKMKKGILNNIKRGLSKKISENSDFNDLINKLLEVDPKKRMSWKEYFKHPFLINKISGHSSISFFLEILWIEYSDKKFST